MSHRRLPNAMGTVVRCDGCGAESITGQIVVTHHRWWLRTYAGWGRGQLRPTGHDQGTTGKDFCPTCAERDHASAERRRRPRITAVRARRQRMGAQP